MGWIEWCEGRGTSVESPAGGIQTAMQTGGQADGQMQFAAISRDRPLDRLVEYRVGPRRLVATDSFKLPPAIAHWQSRLPATVPQVRIKHA